MTSFSEYLLSSSSFLDLMNIKITTKIIIKIKPIMPPIINFFFQEESLSPLEVSYNFVIELFKSKSFISIIILI